MQNIQIIFIHDLKNPATGKSYREENLEKKHKYKIGDLVEIIESEDNELAEVQNTDGEFFERMRLYVIGTVRDCDGTPLYVLGSKGMPLYQPETSQMCYNYKSYSGFTERDLRLIN